MLVLGKRFCVDVVQGVAFAVSLNYSGVAPVVVFELLRVRIVACGSLVGANPHGSVA